MSEIGVRSRGRPLVALLALMLVWGGARAMLWEAPFAPSQAHDSLATQTLADQPQADQTVRDLPAPGPAAPAVQPGLLPQLHDRPTPWLRPAAPSGPVVMTPGTMAPGTSATKGAGSPMLARKPPWRHALVLPVRIR